MNLAGFWCENICVLDGVRIRSRKGVGVWLGKTSTGCYLFTVLNWCQPRSSTSIPSVAEFFVRTSYICQDCCSRVPVIV